MIQYTQKVLGHGLFMFFKINDIHLYSVHFSCLRLYSMIPQQHVSYLPLRCSQIDAPSYLNVCWFVTPSLTVQYIYHGPYKICYFYTNLAIICSDHLSYISNSIQVHPVAILNVSR